MKRLLSGLGRRGRRGPRLSMTLIAWAAVLFSAFIASGGVYDLLDDPLTVIPAGEGWVLVDPRPGEQTLNESLVVMILTMFMFTGMLVAHRSTQVVYDQKKANMTLILGIVLILLGLAGSHYLIILKRTIGR